MSATHTRRPERDGLAHGLANRLGSLSWLHWAALAISTTLTFVGYQVARHQVDARIEARFEREADQALDLVRERMSKYEDALWSGVSMLDVLDGAVDHEQWRRFASSMQIEQKYPGINGLGVIHYVGPGDLSGYLARQKAARPDFSVHPEHDLPEHWPISYIEPVQTNRAAVGLDIAHEANRLAAAKAARETGLAQVTGPIVLVQDENQTPGFLFYAPFYETNPRTGEKEFRGLVYAPFVVARLMEGTLGRTARHLGIRITDQSSVMYDDHRTADPAFDPDPQFQRTVALPMYGRTWTVDLRSDRTFREASESAAPITILAGGLAIDVLLLLLFLGLSRSERRAVHYAEQMTAQLREQKSVAELARTEAEAARHRAESAAEAKARFLATMSHELRTPMNGVIATADLLRDEPEGPRRDELVATIITSGQTLLALINDVLDFSKLEASRIALSPQPTRLEDLFHDVISLLEAQAREQGLDLDSRLSPDLPEWVLVDDLRLRQVVLNLASNALKFTEAGRIELAVLTTQTPEHYRFEVRDTGIGIEDADGLFAEFVQADASTTRRFGGTGLGLAISQRLISAMGGEIQVESIVGEGSVFWFELPLPTAEPRVSAFTPAENPRLFSGNRRALVVDDNRVNRMVAAAALVRLGWTADEATNGAEAVDAVVGNEPYDLILMDCQMPVLDGYEATERLRRDHGCTAPIVALTADALPEHRKRCAAVGMNDHLAKPIRVNDLEELTRRLFSGA